jgi:hypothetical protein
VAAIRCHVCKFYCFGVLLFPNPKTLKDGLKCEFMNAVKEMGPSRLLYLPSDGGGVVLGAHSNLNFRSRHCNAMSRASRRASSDSDSDSEHSSLA